MRILYSHRIQSRDGQSVHVEELIHALRLAGHEVMVVGPKAYEQNEFGGESPFIAKMRQWLPGATKELAELAYNIPMTFRLFRTWRSFRPDFIYERYNLHFLSGSLLARLFKVPLYIEVNSPLAEERKADLRLKRLAYMVERFIWRSATGLFPVTRVLGDMIEAVGVSKDRISVIPNGIVLDRFPLREESQGAKITLGFVGFVRKWHGLDLIISSIARHITKHAEHDLFLMVIGDGPVREDLETQAKALGIDYRTMFVGVVPQNEVAKYVGWFDIALQPSANHYASPLKIFDYMAAGCAIVAPDQPNIREILEHERTALLFDPELWGTQWEAIERLIMDGDLRRRLGENARKELEDKNYTWSGNARRIVARVTGRRSAQDVLSTFEKIPTVQANRQAAPPQV